MRRIAVIGSGYVGLVTGTCFAELGNTVRFIDKDRAKIASLRAGAVPFYEPGLSELVTRNAERGRLSFHHAMREGLRGSEIVIIAVGTPLGEDGHADVRQVREAAKAIAEHIDGHKIVVNKSTVPVETGDLVAAIIREHNSTRFEVRVVSNPEFLREGSAIADFMRPDRVVIGSDDETALEAMRALYAPLGAPIIETDVRTAEMIKYTANAFLATKISFINEIANICERVGADVLDVVTGVGSDKRIGTAFMSAGIGFGGSCLPKDVKALACIAAQYGVAPAVLQAVLDVNAGQIERTLAALEEDLGELRGKRIGLLGLAFKPNTDDVRDSQAVALATALAQRGAI
ncbi:MAG: UDP-glucose/GDP-mannose dehydrogenase family protein, partial [Candidatus Eremiobacteraeota bacterium]|nr:UDP-glucose/GDP-mannose dehydrogenase family protein [Candidatus Eremiobacteraeota bacterium]